MAAQVKQLEMYNNTDAQFRAWGKAMSDQMALGGWVQTSDTGQINWATVTKPVGLVDMRGYEVWRSNDAAGSLLEIYARLEWGSGGTSANQPYMNVTVGMAGTDGAGNVINGVGIGGANMTTDGAAGLVNCILSVGTGWFIFMMGQTANKIMFFSVERTRNASYLFQNELLTLVHASSNYYSRLIQGSPFRVLPQIVGGNTHIIPLTSTWYMFDGTITLGMYVGWRGFVTNPGINAYGFKIDALGGSYNYVNNVMAYNQNHNYIIAPNVADAQFNSGGGFQQLIRFE